MSWNSDEFQFHEFYMDGSGCPDSETDQIQGEMMLET